MSLTHWDMSIKGYLWKKFVYSRYCSNANGLSATLAWPLFIRVAYQ